MFQQATTIGILLANLVNYATQDVHPDGWRISLGLAVVPSAILCLGGIFLPESANSLAERDHVEAAQRNLQKLRGNGEDIKVLVNLDCARSCMLCVE